MSLFDARYAEPAFAYGKAPNDFLREQAASIPGGPVLCLCEGQGRNAVFLAGLGHAVTAVDRSAVGLARARELASEAGVTIETVCADLDAYDLGVGWSGIVSVFAHLPPVLRRKVHRAVVDALHPGGLFLLEWYTPAQIGFGVGGPTDPTLCGTAADLRDELAGLEIVTLVERRRVVDEGAYHRGEAEVVQLVARRP